MEKPILFDFDDTLFSKTEFKKKFNQGLAESCGETPERISDLMSDYIKELRNSDDFRLNEFTQYLGEKTGKKECFDRFKIDNPEMYSSSLFDETIVTLDELKKTYDNLGIFTQGFDDFQNTKINGSGIRKFFDEKYIYIGRNKLDPEFLEKIPDGSTIIDDKKSVVEALKNTGRFDVIWINRKDDEKMDGVTTIKNLTELTDLITSKNSINK